MCDQVDHQLFQSINRTCLSIQKRLFTVFFVEVNTSEKKVRQVLISFFDNKHHQTNKQHDNHFDMELETSGSC